MGYREEECREEPEVVWSGEELDWIRPRGDRAYLRGVGIKYLLNEIYEEGWKKILQEYRPARKYRIGLILPCSYGKPYSQSFIHYFIRKAIADYIRKDLLHEIIVTNAGVVPRELDEHWPYTAYDWNPFHETPGIKRCYTAVLARRLTGFLETHGNSYEDILAYLRWDSDSWAAVRIASRNTGIPIENLAPVKIDEKELEAISLNGLYSDPDLILITPGALEKLRQEIRERLI